MVFVTQQRKGEATPSYQISGYLPQRAPSSGLLLFWGHLPRASMHFLIKYFPWTCTDILQKMVRERGQGLTHPNKSLMKKLNKLKRWEIGK